MRTRSISAGHDRLIMALACLGSFVVVLDATIVSVVLPRIRTELGFGATTLPWTVNAYTLAFAGALLLGGRCADVFGQRRILLAGMGVFTAASLAAGLAPGAAVLLAARAVQGFGGALLMPTVLSLLTSTFAEGARRARALSTWSAVGAVGAASGPIVGGALTQLDGWRWVFFVNVPLGVIAVIGAVRLLPPTPRTDAGPRLDIVGALLVTAGLTGIVYAVMESQSARWGQPVVAGPLIAGLVLCVAFLAHQARWAADPLMPLSLFKTRAVGSANLVMFLLGLGFFGAPVFISFALQYAHGFGPLAAGAGFLPAGLAMFAGAVSAGPLTVRLGPRRAATLGCVTGALGFLAVAALLDSHGSYLLTVAIPSAVFGFGTASAFTPLTVVATSGVAPTHSGVAAAVLNTVRQTSGAIGLAVMSTVAAAVTAGRAAAPDALVTGYDAAFLVSGCCVAAAAAVAAIALPRSGRAPTPSTGATPEQAVVLEESR